MSVKEVETVFLRRQAEALGFKCDHSKVGYAKSDNKPYCKGCWVRLEQIKPPVYSGKQVKAPGQFKPLKTFLDSGKLIALNPEPISASAVALSSYEPN